MKRIRYRRTPEEGVLESVQRYPHLTNGARYRILLNLKEHQWFIVDDYSDIIAASGLRVNQHKMKIDARDALDKLGVKIEVESRAKRQKT